MSKRVKLNGKQLVQLLSEVKRKKPEYSFNDCWWLTVFGKIDLPCDVVFEILSFVLIDKLFLNNFGLTNKSAHFLTVHSIKSVYINKRNMDFIPRIVLNNVKRVYVKGDYFRRIKYKKIMKNLKKMIYLHISDNLSNVELNEVCDSICKPLDMLKMSDNQIDHPRNRYELGRFGPLKTIIIDIQNHHNENKYDFKDLKVTNLVCGYYLIGPSPYDSNGIYTDNWINKSGLKTMIYTSLDFRNFGQFTPNFETITKLSIKMNSLGGTLTWKGLMRAFPNVQTLNIRMKFWSLNHDSIKELIGVLKEFKTPSLTKMVLFWFKTFKNESGKFVDFTNKTLELQTLIHCFIPKMEDFPIKHSKKLIKKNCDDEGTWFIKCKNYRQFIFQITHTVDELGSEFDLK